MPLLQMSEEQALVTVETVKALLDGAERELEEEAVRSLSNAAFSVQLQSHSVRTFSVRGL